MSEWMQIALSPATLRRGARFAVVVGALLIAINHGDALVAGDVDAGRLLKMGLTVLVPFLVSTFSTVGATLEMRGAAPPPR